MSILQEFESMKYRFVLDLIDKEEQYDKKRDVLTGTEAFNMCFERYKLMQEILLPLKKKLGDRVDVTDITFVNGCDNENGIIVNYKKDDKRYFITISNLDYEDIDVMVSDSKVQTENFIENNRNIILQIFRDISDNNLDEDINIKSTTGKFTIIDNRDYFTIKDTDSKVFSIGSRYSIYEKKGNIISPQKLVCNFPKLKELLDNEDNIKLIYDHIRIYESNDSKGLTKKLTYR